VGTTGERAAPKPGDTRLRRWPIRGCERSECLPDRSPFRLADSFAEIVARAKAATAVPVALGFGISTPAQARAAADAGADGVIVGSRLVRAAGEAEDPAGAVGALVAELAAGLRGSGASTTRADESSRAV
jgi:hypothetical protein